jgi:hypothetical protein
MKINEENKLEVIKNQEKIKDKKEENEEKNDKKTEKLEKFDSEQYISVNSPKLIQEILHLSARMPEDRTTENNIIKSLYSVNEKILPILQSGSNIDDDIDVTNFNPYLQEKMRKNNLLKLNFKEISIDNNYLNTKLKQYKDLEKIISDYIKDSQSQTENFEQKKMFLIKHPLISLFKEKIDLKKIEEDLYNEYQNKMKDNTKYKYQEILNLQNDNHLNNNDNNDNDYQDNSIIESYSNNSNEEDQEEEEYNFDNSDDNSNMSLEPIDNHIINANAEQNHNDNNDNNNANNENNNNNNNDTNNNNNNNNQNINDNNSSDNYSGDNVI